MDVLLKDDKMPILLQKSCSLHGKWIWPQVCKLPAFLRHAEVTVDELFLPQSNAFHTARAHPS